MRRKSVPVFLIKYSLQKSFLFGLIKTNHIKVSHETEVKDRQNISRSPPQAETDRQKAIINSVL